MLKIGNVECATIGFFVEWHGNLRGLFNAEAILEEEHQWYYLIHRLEDKSVLARKWNRFNSKPQSSPNVQRGKQTNHEIQARRPDILILDKTFQGSVIIDVTISGNMSVTRKEKEKTWQKGEREYRM